VYIKVINIKRTIEDLLSTDLEDPKDICYTSTGSILVEVFDKEEIIVLIVPGTLYYGEETKTGITVRIKEIR
jgi:hypothetical protein